jgi:hypothetical protein
MIGGSRVSFFMNRFRKPGLSHYNGDLQILSSLLKFVLHNQRTFIPKRSYPLVHEKEHPAPFLFSARDRDRDPYRIHGLYSAV